MHWSPLTSSNAISKLEEAREIEVLDFKREYDFSDLDSNDTRFELAKDIAAFANHMGGTIVVGAIEDRKSGRLAAFKSLADSKAIVKATDEAGQFCLPVPIAAVQIVELDEAQQQTLLGRGTGDAVVTLAAINVHAHVAAPVGVRVWRKGKKGDTVEGAYTFPRRGAEGTRFLRPEELSLIMDAQYRRTLLQLDQIEEGTWISVWVPMYTLGLMTQTGAVFVRVDHDTGTLLVKSHDPEPVRCEVPVAFVRAVWRASDRSWSVALSGSMLESDHRGWASRFNPVL